MPSSISIRIFNPVKVLPYLAACTDHPDVLPAVAFLSPDNELPQVNDDQDMM